MSANYQSNLADLLTTATVLLTMSGRTKQEVIDELLGVMQQANRLHDVAAARKAVIEREKKLSTGLGRGIAVPHGKTVAVSHLCGAFGIHREGVLFDSADGQPCHLFFLILSPMTESGPHVKALSDIAKHLRHPEIRERLLTSTSAEDILNIFSTKEQS